MPGNPNMQKMGKRKNPPGRQQPDWLFPSTEKAIRAPKSLIEDQMKNKQDRKLAKDLLKRRAAGEPPKSAPPAQLLELIGAYLSELEFTGASQALETERTKRGEKAESVVGAPSLATIFNEWCDLKGVEKGSLGHTEKELEKPTKKQAKAKIDSSSESDTDSSSQGSYVEMAGAPPAKKVLRKSPSVSSSSSSSSSSDSDADDEKEVPAPKAASPKPKANGLKRKAPSTSDSSSSSSDSSSESDVPRNKRVKIAAIPSHSSGSSSSSSDSESNSDDETSKVKVIKESSVSTDSGTSSSSDSDSSSSDEEPKVARVKAADSSSDIGTSSSESDDDSDSSTNSVAKNIPLPASDSESSSDSESESPSKEIKKKPAVSSDTSATLSDGPKKMTPSSSDSSSDSSSSSSDSESQTKVAKVAKAVTTTTRKLSPPLPPDPVAKFPKKKTNEPFSRIPKDTKVDERLASNAYVPYDYAQKAHEDLIVTRGKGFTKEKNKKKRGSYRGGYIDVDGKKGIKFED